MTDFILDTIVNLTANIEPVSIDVYVCLSNDDVENCDESIPASAQIDLLSLGSNFDSYTLNMSDFDSDGKASLDVMPGSYQLIVNHTLSSDPNATDFNSFYQLQNVQVNLFDDEDNDICLLYTSPSPRDGLLSRMPSSA